MKNLKRVSLKKIEDEYLPDEFGDTEDIFRLKEVIEGLDDLDRAIIIVYADEQSMAKTARKFGVSSATIFSHINRIRNIIKERI